MRGRNIRRYSRQLHTTLLSSRKMGCSIKVESFAELLHAYQYEFDTSVKRYSSQPATFEFLIDGRKRKYTPDFMVEMASGFTKYVEVHPLTNIDESYAEKLSHFEALVASKDWGFELCDAVKIGVKEQLYLQNCARINSARSITLPEGIGELPFPQSITFADLISLLGRYSHSAVRCAMELLARNVYEIPCEDLVISTVLSRGA